MSKRGLKWMLMLWGWIGVVLTYAFILKLLSDHLGVQIAVFVQAVATLLGASIYLYVAGRDSEKRWPDREEKS